MAAGRTEEDMPIRLVSWPLAFAALESWAVPFAVHHANGFRGDRFGAEMASYGIGLAGLLYVGSQGTETAVWTGAIVFPLAQIATSIWILSSGTN